MPGGLRADTLMLLVGMSMRDPGPIRATVLTPLTPSCVCEVVVRSSGIIPVLVINRGSNIEQGTSTDGDSPGDPSGRFTNQ